MMLSRKGDMGVTGLWLTIITACGFGVAGTILGCLAVSSILESRGRLRGLGMGWFAAVTWPLLVVVGIPLSIPWFTLAERPDRVERQPAAANDMAIEAAPMIQFTFTSVELREEAGTRWLAMDYVEQVRGDCEHTFRYDARVPGFTAQTRMDSYLSDAKAGFAPVLHQRVLWKLPESLPQADALALRDLVAKEWIGKSAAVEPGDERVLFKTLVPDGGTLATAIGVKLKREGASADPSAEPAAELDEAEEILRHQTAEIRIRLARAHFEIVQKKLAAGVSSQEKFAAAERQMVIAEARDDAVTVARANLKFADNALAIARKKFEAGVISSYDFRLAEGQRAIVELELRAALKSTKATPK